MEKTYDVTKNKIIIKQTREEITIKSLNDLLSEKSSTEKTILLLTNQLNELDKDILDAQTAGIKIEEE